jgi:hypothetical protein
VQLFGTHPCTICGVLTQDALAGNRLLFRTEVQRLPAEEAPTVIWRCRSHQRYEMRQATEAQVSAHGDVLLTLTCGHQVCWVFRGRSAYPPLKLQQALTTRQIRLDQPQRCSRCGDLERERKDNP